MSSVTRATFRVRRSGSQSVSLDSVLGPGGAKSVQQTFDSLCDGKAPLLGDMSARSQMAWKRTGQGTYQLDLTGQQLGGLRNAAVTVTVEFRQGVARVRHELKATSTTAQVDSLAEGQAARLATRCVNQVLAATVANHVRVKLQQEMKVKQGVQVSVAQNNTLQIYAEV